MTIMTAKGTVTMAMRMIIKAARIIKTMQMMMSNRRRRWSD